MFEQGLATFLEHETESTKKSHGKNNNNNNTNRNRNTNRNTNNHNHNTNDNKTPTRKTLNTRENKKQLIKQGLWSGLHITRGIQNKIIFNDLFRKSRTFYWFQISLPLAMAIA